MIIIISSAKTMLEQPSRITTKPPFLSKTKQLKEIIEKKDLEELSKIWACSKEKALEYKNLFSLTSATMAINAYNGIVFKQFKKDNLDYLNKHLRIISAYYGLLKPNNGITPYRLEMECPLKVNNQNLYNFWGKDIYNELNDHIIINLASKEYDKCVRDYLNEDDLFIDIDFIEIKNNKLLRSSTNLKKVRGLFLDYLVQNNIEDLDKLKDFNYDGYTFDTSSTQTKLIFTKKCD